MKNRNFGKKIILGAFLVSPLLFGCAPENLDSSLSHVYTVDFKDEAGVSIGYAYVIEDKAASFKPLEGVTYDYSPRSDIEINTLGCRYVFDSWKGNYADGTAVDINYIKGDCSVKATFIEKPYKIETIFKNDAKTYTGGAKVDYGTAISFPSASPSEELPEYYYSYNFLGWTSSKDKATTKHPFTLAENLSYKWKSGASINQDAWGLGAPSDSDATGNAGVIYLDKTLDNHMPKYQTYLSDGSKWIDLGKLATDTLKLEFESTYAKQYKEFEVSICDVDKTTVLSTFSATYGSDITYTRTVSGNITTIAVKYAGVIKHTYTIDTTNKVSYLMEGSYKNKTNSTNKHSDSIEGTAMTFSVTKDSLDAPNGGSSKLQGNVNIYPLVSDLH